MIPWKLLDTARVPGSTRELRLYQRDHEFSIRVDRHELMNSRMYSTNDPLANQGCARIAGRSAPRVLVGGLGMGFCLRTALDSLPAQATVIVAELVPQVVVWNRDLLGHLTQHPLRDPRVSLRELDVGRVLREAKAELDLIMLDVDNGAEGLTRQANDWIYSRAGLLAARAALRPGGVVGYWSAGPDTKFVRRLQQVGFNVQEITISPAKGYRGASHTLWFAVVKA